MNIFIILLAWVLIGFFAVGILGGPAQIGKPRKPYTAGSYVVALIVSSINIVLLVILTGLLA